MSTTKTKIPHWLIATIFVTGFALSVYAIWWWQYKDMRTFTDESWQSRAIKFQGNELRSNLLTELKQFVSPEKINVINFVRPGCECNKSNALHLKELSSAFGDKINFVTLTPASYKLNADSSTLQNVHGSTLDPDLIPAAPAAVIIDATGELVYFGTYSTGMLCGEGDNLVEARLRKLLKGNKVERWLNTRGYGCFCDWK